MRLAVNVDSLAIWVLPALAEVGGLLYDLTIDDQDHSAELRSYLVGFAAALALTLAAFALVLWGGLSRGTTIATIGAFALVQMIVHLRFFLHIDLSRQKREDLQLILFSVLLLAIMAVGTIWIMGNLATRM